MKKTLNTEIFNELGYQPTETKEIVISKTVRRDHEIESLARSILGIESDIYNIIQDPKGRVTIYNKDNKPIFKYRPHSKGIVIFFPKRSRSVAETIGLKLTNHGYFGLEGCLDTDIETFKKALTQLTECIDTL